MENINENIETTKVNIENSKQNESFKETPINVINEKLYRKELEIEDILQNDDCINDLRNNFNSRYKIIITLDSIKNLINNCLKPGWINDNNPNKFRYSYYSCQILCSPCALLFKKSIKNIKRYTYNKNNGNEFSNTNINNNTNTNNVISTEEEKKEIKKSEENNDKKELEEGNEESNIQEEHSYDFFEDISEARNELESSLDEKFEDFLKIQKETEAKIKALQKKSVSELDNDDNKIINEILNEIFRNLDYPKYEENETYIGYFQTIANYLLLHESDIIINYLFKDKNPIISKFYKCLNSASIQNILENILNILSDEEEKDNKIILLNDKNNDMKVSNYLEVIKNLWKILIKDNSFENTEFISELIINTIINNSDKQLINFFFQDNYAMESIKNFFINNIDEKNTKRIIGIINIFCNLNKIIMNSIIESSIYQKNKGNLEIFLNFYRKIDNFNGQYLSKKNISLKKIFESFQKNGSKYLQNIEKIYNIVKDNSKNNYNTESKNGNNQNFGLLNIYKWKFILSSLKIYIYSFYVLEERDDFTFKSESEKHFGDDELFYISIELYFVYRKNNIYQNIFIEIIKLIFNEKCPKYLTIQLLENKKNMLNLIIENLAKENKNKKDNLLVGPDIEILKLLFFSANKTIIDYIKKYNIKKIKDIYNNSIYPKFERKLNDDNFSLSFSQIIQHSNDDTFDANDSKVQKKFSSIQTIIQHFLEKIKNKESKEIEKKIINEKIDGSKKIAKKNIKMYDNLFEEVIIQEIDNSGKIMRNKEEKIFELKRENKMEIIENNIY